MVRVLEIERIRSIIVGFSSSSSYFPLLYLSMTIVGEKDVKYFMEHFSDHLYYTKKTTTSLMESLHLLRWHCESWKRMKSMRLWKGYPRCKSSILTNITPYDPILSLEDLDFYFQFVGVSGWKEIRECKKTYLHDHMSDFDLDAIILAEDRELIAIEEVGIDTDNVILPILGGRWDIADKYMRRGDVGYNSGWRIINRLSKDNLTRLIHTYDLWEVLEDIDVDNNAMICLLRGGILPRQFLREKRTYDAASRLPVPLSEVPMNVVEDLFTVTLLRGTEYAGRLNLDFSVSTYAEETFFSLLRRSKGETDDVKISSKSGVGATSASATHRRYKIEWIENGIIKSIRTGSGYPASNMNALLSSLHLVRDGYILPEEKQMLDYARRC